MEMKFFEKLNYKITVHSNTYIHYLFYLNELVKQEKENQR